MTMDVAVIGTGNIGGTLGRSFACAGHRVHFGSRRPGDDAAPGDTDAEVTGVREALEHADVVVLAVPTQAVEAFVEEHAGALAGKLVVDATNNISGQGPANSHDVIAALAPDVRYARAFNSLGFENLRDPRFGDETADMFFSASDADAATVAELVTAVGLRPVHVGESRDAVDGLLRLWFALAQRRGRHLAFRLLDDSGG
jgi:8-hydroxy-5-deazaflavin:NADPH oxidoreductase